MGLRFWLLIFLLVRVTWSVIEIFEGQNLPLEAHSSAETGTAEQPFKINLLKDINDWSRGCLVVTTNGVLKPFAKTPDGGTPSSTPVDPPFRLF